MIYKHWSFEELFGKYRPVSNQNRNIQIIQISATKLFVPQEKQLYYLRHIFYFKTPFMNNFYNGTDNI